MYKEVLFSVKVQDGATDFFSSQIGVKQGCILSPTLFSLYINDLPDLFNSECYPVCINNSPLSSLLYADDLVLISESAEGLQNCIDKLDNYCEKWNLTINLDKTKIMSFNKSGRKIIKDMFTFRNATIEQTMEYKYLGIIFKPSGVFSEAINLLCKKASKAIFCIRKMLFSDKMNVPAHIRLFESCISPILLYCSEIWCVNIVKNDKSLESKYLSMQPVKIQIKFAKYLLGVNKAAVNLAVLSELGMYPIGIQELKSAIGFWLHILNSDDRLLYDAYQANSCISDGFYSKIKILLNKLNFSLTWENHGTFSKTKLLKAIILKLNENFVSFWKSSIYNDENSEHGNKLRTFRKVKSGFKMEKYLLYNFDKNIVHNFTKLRISNSKLAIETGRFNKTKLENRICPICSSGTEDEYHFIISCSKLSDLRKKLFDEIGSIVPSFNDMNDQGKFEYIFTCDEYDISHIIIKGISLMYNTRCEMANSS